MRAAGLSPKETFETPSVVWMPGYFAVSRRIASIVSMASRRVSSWPVAIGKVRQSTMMSLTFMPHSPDERVDEARGDAHLVVGRCGPGPARRSSAR